MTEAEIKAIVDKLADIAGVLRDAGPPGWPDGLVKFGECARVEADGERLAGRERMPGVYLGVQGVLVAAEGALAGGESWHRHALSPHARLVAT
jgi:hypothetical protein